MDTIIELFRQASKEYNARIPHYGTCFKLIEYCHSLLREKAVFRVYGDFKGTPPVEYSVFEADESLSRPVRADLYLQDLEDFGVKQKALLAALKNGDLQWTENDRIGANQVVYTSIMAFACCFDIWKRSSRKTPGTFFEVYMAAILQEGFPDAEFSKHISLPGADPRTPIAEKADGSGPPDESLGDTVDEATKVSTDVVIGISGHVGGIVIPLKITTRERIVQPFAHQRILDAAFGTGVYRSMIVCISETQLDGEKVGVNQVCVPGTISLFQKYLAPIYGLYYCDLPQRYAAKDLTSILNVRLVGSLFEDLKGTLSGIREQAKAGKVPPTSPRAPGRAGEVL